MEGGAGFQMTYAEVERVSELLQMDEELRKIHEMSTKDANRVDSSVMFMFKPANCTEEDLFVLNSRVVGRYDKFDELETYASMLSLKWQKVDTSKVKWFTKKG
jgi:hypothetical protein